MNTQGNGQLFSNRLLERLTRTHIAVPLTIFYTTAAGILIYSLYVGFVTTLSNLWLFVAGVLAFTLLEYLVHRFAFHIDTDTPSKAKFQHKVHGLHHDFPRDKSRLAMPPVISVTLAAFFFALYRVLMGHYGLPFTAGFMAGYATYLCVHYAVHAFRPPKNFLKILWAHHAIHHYQQPDAAFGVSSPLWDLVFGTMPRRGKPHVLNTETPV